MLSRIPTILLSIYIVNSVLASRRTDSTFQPPSMPLLPGLTSRQQQRAGKLVGVSVNDRPNLAQILAPRKFHLRKKKLLKKLGEKFDPLWMSIEQPSDFFKVKVNDENDPEIANDWIRSVHPLGLMTSLRALNITRHNSQDLTEEAYNKHTSNRGQVDNTVKMVMSVLQDWLVKKATCPVQYIWEDMGNLFWPRYIRQGYCARENIPEQVKARVRSSLSDNPIIEQDCSWPPGMFCVPGEEKRLKILTWKCQPSRAARKRKSTDSAPMSYTEEPTRIPYDREVGQTPAVGGTKGSLQRTLESVGSARRFVAQKKAKPGYIPKKDLAGASRGGGPMSTDGQDLSSFLSKMKSSREKRSVALPEELVGYMSTRFMQSLQSLPQRDSPPSDSITELEPKEDYSDLTWREVRKKFKVKCRWQKITFPVTQHCQCSC